jgi:hypothetical protein
MFSDSRLQNLRLLPGCSSSWGCQQWRRQEVLRGKHAVLGCCIAPKCRPAARKVIQKLLSLLCEVKLAYKLGNNRLHIILRREFDVVQLIVDFNRNGHNIF